MNKLSLNKLSPKKLSKDGGTSVKLPKGLKVSQLGLAVVCVILLALTVYFAVAYIQGLTTKDGLTNDIDQAKADIASHPPKNISELLVALEDAVDNTSKNAPFPKSVDDTELATQLVEIARDSNTPYFKFNPPTGNESTTIGKNIYPLKSYAISFGTATTLPKVINFLKNLEELPYGTSRITGLTTGKSGDLYTLSLDFEIILQKQ